MNKKLLAIAVAAFIAAPAIATAQTTLFGQVKYEVGVIDSDVNDERNFVHSTRGSRLGVRGAEDLGGGMQAIFRLQSGFAAVNTSLAEQGMDWTEEAWVGLQGGFGRILLGRSDTAVKNASLPFRAFTDTLADLNNRPAGWQRAEGIHYVTPNFSGFTVGLTVEPTGNETDVYYALNAIYKQGPLFVSAAVEASPSDLNPFGDPTYAVGDIGQDETNYQIGASYNFGPGDVGLLYQARNDGDDDVFTIPVNYKVTPNINLRGAVQHVSPDVGESYTNFAVGAQYLFSSRTEAFVNVWVDDTPDSPSSVRGATVLNSNDSAQIGVGLRHSF